MTSGTAWGWVAHLTDGGTTPWAAWSAPAEPRGDRLPGAQNLELLRRLNLAGRPGPGLVEGVLAVDPSRRSRPALPLAGGPDPVDHGPRPVHPADLRDGELSRLAAVLLARRLADSTPPAPPAPGLRRPWRTHYRLAGDPELVVPLRRHLVARGRPPGGRHPRLLVLSTDTGQALVDLWTAQSLHHGAPPWQEWIATTTRQYRLPEGADPDLVARAQPARTPVHVVTDARLAPRLLGVRRGPRAGDPLAASAVDLGRRIASALRPMAPAPRRARLMGEVVRPWLATGTGAPLVVPEAYRDWVRAEADRVLGEVRRDRYPVHGDPALLLPADRPGTPVVASSETLALAVRLLLERTEETT